MSMIRLDDLDVAKMAAAPQQERQECVKALHAGTTLLHVRYHTAEAADAAERILKESQAHELGRAP